MGVKGKKCHRTVRATSFLKHTVSYFLRLGLRFLAVLAAALKLAAVGAPFVPGFRIFSPDPAAMRLRFA